MIYIYIYIYIYTVIIEKVNRAWPYVSHLP